METITKETFEKFNNEKERLFQYLEKLIDIGLSLDKEYEVIDSDWGNTFTINIDEIDSKKIQK